MDYAWIIRKEAEADISDAFAYYESCRHGLGQEFILCLEAGLESIKRNPQRFRTLYKNVSRCIFHRFPYGIFYLIQDNRIIVLGMMHVRRNPVSWP